MTDKLSLQPSRCNFYQACQLWRPIYSPEFLCLYLSYFTPERKGFCIFEWRRIQSHNLNYTTYFETSYLKCFSNSNILCISKPAQITKVRDCEDEGAQSNRAAGGIRLSHTICNTQFSNILILTCKQCQCVLTFKFTPSQTLPFLLWNRWIKKALLKALRQILIQYTPWKTLLWGFQFTRKRQTRTNFVTAVLVKGLSRFRLCQQVNTTQLLTHLLPQRDGEKNQIKKLNSWANMSLISETKKNIIILMLIVAMIIMMMILMIVIKRKGKMRKKITLQ